MGTKGGHNWYQSIHYDVLLPASVLYLAPRGTITRGAYTFSAASVPKILMIIVASCSASYSKSKKAYTLKYYMIQ
jgi:hypothetical protein